MSGGKGPHIPSPLSATMFNCQPSSACALDGAVGDQAWPSAQQGEWGEGEDIKKKRLFRVGMRVSGLDTLSARTSGPCCLPFTWLRALHCQPEPKVSRITHSPFKHCGYLQEMGTARGLVEAVLGSTGCHHSSEELWLTLSSFPIIFFHQRRLENPFA